MKHNTKILFALVISGLFAFTACTQQQPAAAEIDQTATDSARLSMSRLLFSLDTAIRDVKTFDMLSREKLHDTIPIKAFSIRSEDLLIAMGMKKRKDGSYTACEFRDIRVYLGYDTSFKLFIVPVKDADLDKGIAGTDVFLDKHCKPIPPHKDGAATTAYVLDLNAPCPNTCATSPLNPQ